MRILQLDIGGQRIEFHPYFTVVRGADDGLRQQLIDALGALSAGHPSVDGLVEAHGVVLDLTQSTLSLLDLGAGNGLDIVVRPDQLPTNPTSVGGNPRPQLERARAEALDRLGRAESDADRAAVALFASREALGDATGGGSGDGLQAPRSDLERLAERRAELHAATDAARTAHTDARTAQAEGEERVESARALRAEAGRACSVAAGALESARAVRDPFAASALDAARERLAALEAAVAASADDVRVEPEAEAERFDDPVGELARLEGRRLELEAALLALDTVDPFPVQSALSHLRAADADGELAPSEHAIRMADELADITASIGEGTPDDAVEGNAIAIARRRLDAARAAVFDAERAVRLPEVDRFEIEALENAHEQVLIAQDRADKRLSGDRAKTRLDETRALEQEILDRLGFRTYTEFVMGTSMLNVDPEREKRLESARGELAAAEDALGELEAGVDAELARAALVARRRELHAEAIALLERDPGPDIEWALRHHRVRVQENDRGGRLQDALESAGMALGGEDVPGALLLELAEIWLDEQGETEARRQQLEHELRELEPRLAVVGDAVRALEEESEDDVVDEDAERAARRQSQLEEARSAVRAAETRLERQSEIETDVAQRKADLEAATSAEEAVATALAAAEAEADAAGEAERAAGAERSRLESELAGAVDAEERARVALDELTSRLTQAAQSADRSDLENAVAEAQAEVDATAAALGSARDTVARLDAQLAELDHGGTVAGVTGAATDGGDLEELEWYLLSRVAAQRSVSYAGSVPLVLDDALAGISGPDLVHLLSRLERMSAAVQVIVVSEDVEVAAWAESIGTDRARTLSLQSA